MSVVFSDNTPEGGDKKREMIKWIFKTKSSAAANVVFVCL